jgi:hypothetical protein
MIRLRFGTIFRMLEESGSDLFSIFGAFVVYIYFRLSKIRTGFINPFPFFFLPGKCVFHFIKAKHIEEIIGGKIYSDGLLNRFY